MTRGKAAEARRTARGDVEAVLGDCVEVLAGMPEASFDACVTDPPYGLEFMGQEWDRFRTDGRGNSGRPPSGMLAYQEWTSRWAFEVLRVLRPGGFLLAFGGTRTWHRLSTGIEEAGFKIRDCMMWLYGTGFPKSLDVSKGFGKRTGEVTAPSSSLAESFSGYGTNLKPAWEPIVVAMRPTAGTFASNAETHGVSGLNVEGGRIGREGGRSAIPGTRQASVGATDFPGRAAMVDAGGRFPTNVLLDQDAARILDLEAGGRGAVLRPGTGPSRFFYVAKASPDDRMEGNRHPTVKPADLMRYLVRLVRPPTIEGRPPPRILDPFAGSGSTLVAALAEGVAALGIEKDEESFGTIEERLLRVRLVDRGRPRGESREGRKVNPGKATTRKTNRAAGPER
uniref:Putative methyltransferase n=1 Tax=viral metagenome TaxID=1070528 RepID=A0A6M3JBK4_9ZZZZ